MKSIFTSKTFWFNVAIGGMGVFEYLTSSGVLGPGALVAIGAANVFLRAITKDPVTIQ